MSGFIPPEQVPGEQVLWARNLRRGLIHRHVWMREAVTNRRIYQHNEDTGHLAEVPMWMNFDIVVEDERRDSRGSFGGLYGGGMFYGQRATRSWTVGSILIMMNGVGRMKFTNVSNPASLKTLIQTIKREEKR